MEGGKLGRNRDRHLTEVEIGEKKNESETETFDGKMGEKQRQTFHGDVDVDGGKKMREKQRRRHLTEMEEGK